jgi:UDP-N-acetylglucosamine--N-acetylmuramyl-(pentapeptide) pyrophosphoryl-undecaprenol N-acetylglucosamine transferase
MRDSGVENLRIILAGGGTGGHLFPGIAIAEEITRRKSNASIMFVVAGRETEKQILSRYPFMQTVIASPRSGASAAGKALMLPTLGLAILKARRLLRKFDPHVVIGLGGYASAPVVWAAGSRRPVFLIEQNAVPGRATRMLFRKARRLFTQFDRTAELLPPWAPCVKAGTPLRKELFCGERPHAAEHFGLSAAKRTILVLGGSQGARGVNEIVAEILPRLERRGNEIQILHQTGDLDFNTMRDIYARSRLSVSITRLIERMDLAYAIADVVLCRAGATTIAELTALGLPSVLVPYPYSLDNEQKENALQLANRGAAFIAEQSPAAAGLVHQCLVRLLDDRRFADEMAAQALSLGHPDATETIVSDILKTANSEGPKARIPMHAGGILTK